MHRLSLLVGGALSAPAVGALLAGCRAEPATTGWTPSAMTTEQADLLGVVVDLIIPATDTPGARDAGVHVFIDRVLADWAEPEERDGFLRGLAEMDALMQAAHGVAFTEASADQQTALLMRLDEEAVAARNANAGPLPFFAHLKEWTLAGYYTSEAGATQELQWVATPGRYDPDVTVEEVGRAWA